MTEINVQTRTRDPKSFSDLNFSEKSSRVVTVEYEGSGEPPKLLVIETSTKEYLQSKLQELGTITRFESYFCTDTAMPVTRGSILKDDGREYFFFLYGVQGDIFRKSYWKTSVDHVISQLTYSGRSKNA